MRACTHVCNNKYAYSKSYTQKRVCRGKIRIQRDRDIYS